MIVKELFAKLGLDVDEVGFDRAEALFEGLKKGALGLGLGLAGIIGGMGLLARSTAQAGIEADRAAARMGITTDAVQELQFAADASGVSVGGLETALFKMSRAAYEAKQGNFAAAQAFHGLLTTGDLKNGTPDQMLQKLADGFLKIKDPGTRAAKVMAIFGRGGAELLPLLNRGAEGIAALREEAQELGVVLDKNAIANAREFTAAAHVMEARLEGLRNKLGVVVLRGLLQFAHWMDRTTAAIKRFYNAHTEAIFRTVQFAVMALTAGLITYGYIQAGVIAETIAGWALAAAAAVRSSVAMMWAGIRAIAPWIPMGLAILGLIVVLEDLYGFFTGKQSVIGDFIADIKYLVAEFTSWRDLAKDVFLWLSNIFGLDLDKIGASIQGQMNANGTGTNAAGAAVQYVQTGTTNNGMPVYAARPVNVTNNLTVNTQATDPKAVAGKVQEAMDEHAKKTYREAHEGLP